MVRSVAGMRVSGECSLTHWPTFIIAQGGAIMAKFKTYYERCKSFGGVGMPPFIWNIAGVYCISCQGDSKQYIGLSKDIMRRLSVHFTDLANNTHPNEHLQSAWNKYGARSFYVSVLDYNSVDLGDREIEWISAFDSFNNGFNKTPGGDGITELSEEDAKKAQVTRTKALNTAEVKEKIGKAATRMWNNDYERMCQARVEGAYNHWSKYSAEERTARALRIWEKRRANNLKKETGI